MPKRGSPYGPRHGRARKVLLARGAVCHRCGNVATELDHDPPLSLHKHLEGSGCCRYLPACGPCQRRQGGLIRAGLIRASDDAEVEPFVEPVGAGVDDPVWSAAPWLDVLREVPKDAVWPRLMTAPHPDAVGTLGAELERSTFDKRRRLRWWQRLVAYRLLEIDDRERLLWESMLLTLARQLGKSWFLRELVGWRIRQGDRFGEPQLALHTGNNLAVCKEIQLPARTWAKHTEGWKVREVNGQEEIELLADGSRWMLRAKNAVYGYSVSLGLVDEAWKVSLMSVEDGLEATMIERAQPQLVITSTAHRLATPLCISRREQLITQLWQPGDGLLVEWSAPRSAVSSDRRMWRMASPHWTADREKRIASRLASAEAGASDDSDEPDPMEAFRAQWLNIWPRRPISTSSKGDPLLSDDDWQICGAPDVDTTGPLVVAVEDNHGRGAAAAACGVAEDGRLVVGGWVFTRRAEAFAWAGKVADAAPGSTLIVGASLADDPLSADFAGVVDVATSAQTRVGLPLLRELVAERRLVHNESADLTMQVLDARVTTAPGGLNLVAGTRCDLLKATAWACLIHERAMLMPQVH